MNNEKTKFIVNPRADFGHAWQRAAELHKIAGGFSSVEWSCTVYPGHATELARQACEQGFSLVVAVGGDGTTHEVVNGLMQIPAGSRSRLGVIPMGSGNDFSYAIGMDKNPVAALQQIFNSEGKRVDIGRVVAGDGRQEYWMNAVGIGFDATTGLYFRKLKHLRGVLAYLVAVLQTIFLHLDAPRMVVRTDNENWEEQTIMLVACNGSREGGGFLVAPQSQPYDGVFSYARVCKVSRLTMLRLVPEVMRGTHERFRQVNLGEFHHMEIDSDEPLRIHMDGETFAGFESRVQQLTIEILPNEIEVMT